MKNKVFEILKKHLFTIICVIGLSTWNLTKDLISTGADVKFSQKVIYVVKTEPVQEWVDSLVQIRIESTMKDPLIWMNVLSSSFVGNFAESKAKEVREKISIQIMKQDSIKGSVVNELGISTGIRNEDIIPMLGELIKAYKSGRLYSSRTVRADF